MSRFEARMGAAALAPATSGAHPRRIKTELVGAFAPTPKGVAHRSENLVVMIRPGDPPAMMPAGPRSPEIARLQGLGETKSADPRSGPLRVSWLNFLFRSSGGRSCPA